MQPTVIASAFFPESHSFCAAPCFGSQSFAGAASAWRRTSACHACIFSFVATPHRLPQMWWHRSARLQQGRAHDRHSACAHRRLRGIL